jgi:hypothetical protein
MLDRILSISLKLAITGMIAVLTGVSVMGAYSGFMFAVRAHWREAGQWLGVTAGAGVVAYLLARRRGDLQDT